MMALRSGALESYRCRRATLIDGMTFPDAVDWAFADSVLLSDTVTGAAPREETEVRACWSPEGLHLRFLAEDGYVVSSFMNKNDPLYEQDVVEVFIDEAGDGRGYLELEISPFNVVFDAKLAHDGTGAKIVSEKEWRLSGLRSAVREDGLGKKAYFIDIPAGNFNRPFVSGLVWRVNFYRIDENLDGEREFQAWQPTGAVNFHVPDRFGQLVFD